jgi:hypothetical protein
MVDVPVCAVTGFKLSEQLGAVPEIAKFAFGRRVVLLEVTVTKELEHSRFDSSSAIVKEAETGPKPCFIETGFMFESVGASFCPLTVSVKGSSMNLSPSETLTTTFEEPKLFAVGSSRIVHPFASEPNVILFTGSNDVFEDVAESELPQLSVESLS